MIFSVVPNIEQDAFEWQSEQADTGNILTLTIPSPELSTMPFCSIQTDEFIGNDPKKENKNSDVGLKKNKTKVRRGLFRMIINKNGTRGPLRHGVAIHKSFNSRLALPSDCSKLKVQKWHKGTLAPWGCNP
jgi:hypothetical protein